MLRQLGLSKLLLSPNVQQNLNIKNIKNLKNLKKQRSSETMSKTCPNTIDELKRPENFPSKPQRKRDLTSINYAVKNAEANYVKANNFIYKPIDIFLKRTPWISLYPCNDEFDQNAAINKNLFPLQVQNELSPNRLLAFKKLADIEEYKLYPTEQLPVLDIENILKTVEEIKTRKPIKEEQCLAEKNSAFVDKKSLSDKKVHKKLECNNENILQLKKRLEEVKLSMRNCKVYPPRSSMYLEADKYVGYLVTSNMVQVEANNKVLPRGNDDDEADN